MCTLDVHLVLHLLVACFLLCPLPCLRLLQACALHPQRASPAAPAAPTKPPPQHAPHAVAIEEPFSILPLDDLCHEVEVGLSDIVDQASASSRVNERGGGRPVWKMGRRSGAREDSVDQVR